MDFIDNSQQIADILIADNDAAIEAAARSAEDNFLQQVADFISQRRQKPSDAIASDLDEAGFLADYRANGV